MGTFRFSENLSRSSQTILITGCSSGIGRALVLHLVKAGYAVIATARRLEDIQTLGASLCLSLDVTHMGSVSEALQKIQDKFGHLDVLINNAGLAVRGAVFDLNERAWNTVWSTNFMGPANLIRAGLPLLKASARPRVINISTLSTLTAMPNLSAYTATKAALDAMTRTVQGELAPMGISVTLIRVGLTNTALFANAARYSREFLSLSPTPDSADRRFERVRQKYSSDPASIARAIERVILMSSPPATYVTPPSARFFQVMSPVIAMIQKNRFQKS